MELLAPAGSPEALCAAVQNGADAVYLGSGDFNARRSARNFSDDALAAAVSYCHLRGVKVYLTLNTLLTDRELEAALALARRANDIGVDAVLVADLGLLALLREILPDLPLHASTQLGIHNRAGVRFCASRGLTRVVLARELPREDIKACAGAGAEIEAFVHGALCMSHSGQCYFSALLGGRSGNRGLCAQPCRLAYREAGRTAASYPLSLKDLALAPHLTELTDAGLSCLKIEGRRKRPEYVAAVTAVYGDALRSGQTPGRDDMARLADIFSRSGFTDGYYRGNTGAMLGRRQSEAPPEALYKEARASYEGPERRQVSLSLRAEIRGDRPARLTLRDPEGREVTAEGPRPEAAQRKPLTREIVAAQLTKTGGTVFFIETLALALDEGLSLPLSALNALRREGLAAMEALRTTPPERPSLPWPGLPPRAAQSKGTPALAVRLHRFDQLSEALLKGQPAQVWLPLEAAAAKGTQIAALRERYPAIRFGITLPRAVFDGQWGAFLGQLDVCRGAGIQDVLVGNVGLIDPCKTAGFTLHGDYGLGLFNSRTAAALDGLGFASATVSFELNLAQIADLRTALPLTLLAYGRLPLMLLERDMSKSGPLTDRKGERFPILPHWGGRSELCNGKTLWLADRLDGLPPLDSLQLLFSDEDAAVCTQVLSAYRGLGSVEPPPGFTRGLYDRKVE